MLDRFFDYLLEDQSHEKIDTSISPLLFLRGSDLLFTFDKHDGANIIMPALEEVVHRRNKEYSSKHGRRPVPVGQRQLCATASN